jgi:hypothetical protein
LSERESRIAEEEKSAPLVPSLKSAEPGTEREDSFRTAAPATEIEFTKPAENAPVNLSDVFRRVGATVDLSAEEAATPDRPDSSPRVSEPHRPEGSPPLSQNREIEEEEESIDTYMSRLMSRLRTGGSAADGAKKAVSEPVESAPMEATTPSSPAFSPTSQAAPPTPRQRREPLAMLPRAVAPEKLVDLSALRELANLSAENALGRHARRKLVHSIYSKLLVAVVALMSGLALLSLWSSFGQGAITFYAGIVALLAAAFWGVEYAVLTGRLIVNKAGHIDWNNREFKKPDPTPVIPSATLAGGQPDSQEVAPRGTVPREESCENVISEEEPLTAN